MPLLGRIDITTDPAGIRFEAVSANGISISGVTPATLRDLGLGDYRVTLHRLGWGDYQQTMTLAANDPVFVTHHYEGGSLKVTAAGAGTTVTLNGTPVGAAPLELAVSAGNHTIAATLNGNQLDTKQIEVLVGQASAVNFAVPATPAVPCLCYTALCEWYLGEIASCQATIAEAISLAKELNDMNALANALNLAANLAVNERNPAEVDRLASDLIELSTRHNFVFWLATGVIYRGWARSASGNTAEGISWIEQGTRDYRATGTVLRLPYYLGRKAEAFHLADRTSEALEAINEAEALAERFEHRYFFAELHQLRGVFLTAMGADETQIEASFREAIRIAKEQKSVSLEKRAEGTYAEYHRQKASASEGRGFRLPL